MVWGVSAYSCRRILRRSIFFLCFLFLYVVACWSVLGRFAGRLRSQLPDNYANLQW